MLIPGQPSETIMPNRSSAASEHGIESGFQTQSCAQGVRDKGQLPGY